MQVTKNANNTNNLKIAEEARNAKLQRIERKQGFAKNAKITKNVQTQEIKLKQTFQEM